MKSSTRPRGQRRRLLEFLAGVRMAPCLGMGGLLSAGDVRGAEPPRIEAVEISSPADALNVFDFEVVARTKLAPAHYAYLATGVEADATVRANRDGFARYQIRARRLIDTTRIDMSVDLFGTSWPTPIVIAPVSSLGAFHPDGDLAVARAARTRRHLDVLSTLANASIAEVSAALERPRGFSSIRPPTGTSCARWFVGPRRQVHQ
jgi:4-hydroxymandelate oxidase